MMGRDDQLKALKQFHDKVTSLDDYLFTFDAKAKKDKFEQQRLMFEEMGKAVPKAIQIIMDHFDDFYGAISRQLR